MSEEELRRHLVGKHGAAAYDARYEGECANCGIEESVTLHDLSVAHQPLPPAQYSSPCIGCGKELSLQLTEFGTALTDTGLRGPD